MLTMTITSYVGLKKKFEKIPQESGVMTPCPVERGEYVPENWAGVLHRESHDA